MWEKSLHFDTEICPSIEHLKTHNRLMNQLQPDQIVHASVNEARPESASHRQLLQTNMSEFVISCIVSSCDVGEIVTF